MTASPAPRITSTCRRRKFRVLIADTQGGAIAHLLESLFAKGADSLELTSISSSAMLVPAILLNSPDVIFLDLALFPTETLCAFRTLRRTAANIPLITIASVADKSLAELSLQEGAMDYVLREHADGQTMERILHGALERNTVAGLTDLLRDPLTGVYNREGFIALSQRALQGAGRCGGQLVLLRARLENLTTLHNEFGPSAADQAVKDVAALLQGAFRRTDVIARLNREEFVVLAMDAAEPSAAVMVQRVERHLAALNQSRSPWGSLELRLIAQFWCARNDQPVPGFLSQLGAAQPEESVLERV